MQNAASIASRFRDLYGLEMVMKQELGELQKAQADATQELERLQAGFCECDCNKMQANGLWCCNTEYTMHAH